MGFHRSGCLRLEKFPVDGADGIFIPVLVHTDDQVHFRCALVDDPGADARTAQGIKHPGTHIRAANHTPANHRNHGKAIGDNQAVRVDGAEDGFLQLRPVRLQRLSGNHQAHAAKTRCQMLKGNAQLLQAG